MKSKTKQRFKTLSLKINKNALPRETCFSQINKPLYLKHLKLPQKQFKKLQFLDRIEPGKITKVACFVEKNLSRYSQKFVKAFRQAPQTQQATRQAAQAQQDTRQDDTRQTQAQQNTGLHHTLTVKNYFPP